MPAGVLGFQRVQSAASRDGFVGSARPRAAPARVLQVLLLQWCWQQPTWQAAACTHCSLLFVHCQGKGAGGRAEGEEGTGNYKNQQKTNKQTKAKKKSDHSRDLSWGSEKRALVACRHPAQLPPVNIYTANSTRPEEPALSSRHGRDRPCPRTPGTAGPLRCPSDAHSSLQPTGPHRAGGESCKHSGTERKGRKKEERGVKKGPWVPPPRRGVSPPVCQVRGSPALPSPAVPGRRIPLRPKPAKPTEKNQENNKRKFLPGEQLPWHIFIFT